MKRAALLFLLPFFAVPLTAQAQGTVTFGGGASTSGDANANATASAEPPKEASGDDAEWEERDTKMNEAATLTGGVGLLHTQHAQGGAPGQFRVGFTTEYFSAGFLCTSDFPCPDPKQPNVATAKVKSDSNDHIGGHLTLDMQVLKWLDAYLATTAYANSNDANRPALLQVLGDSVVGAKAHGGLSKVFFVGGGFDLLLVNGTGAVGLSGGGTSAKFRALATADLRGTEKKTPLRFSMNMTYTLDNTGQVVQDTETARGTSITRIERYGLGINRVDHFDIHLGAELFVAQEKVRPFLEYVVNIPVNRQNYLCRPNNPSGDKCLANDAIAPSSLTIGGRFYPWKRGFNLLAALDIGLTGVGEFIEEVRPTPPWMFYIGAGWAFDTVDRPPIVKERVIEKSTNRPGRRIRGWVHEEGSTNAIAGAIVTWDNHPEMTGMVTAADGRFTTHDLQPGPYVFNIKADGYKGGSCQTVIGGAPAPGGQGKPPPPAAAGGEVQVDCPLASLPKNGNIVGSVKSADGGAPVAGAGVKVVDAQGHDLVANSDPNGVVRFQGVVPGDATITVDAEGYLAFTEKILVAVQKDNALEIVLTKRPKESNVKIENKEIRIKQQIQFAIDQAAILPESNGLLAEIADVLIKNPRIKKVEVQGHTDNTGTPEHNQSLSDQRAAAVVTWLTSHGVGGERLVAKGYGQEKPLVPNVTPQNRAQNRRVQFIILDQAEAQPAAPKK
jgi:outer membrane protein OmpA-like peptidoglycan-associated protein